MSRQYDNIWDMYVDEFEDATPNEIKEYLMEVRKNENDINWSEPDCVDECLFSIWAYGADYDGYESPESLKSLIDELVELANKARTLLWEGKLFGIFGDPDNPPPNAHPQETDYDR